MHEAYATPRVVPQTLPANAAVKRNHAMEEEDGEEEDDSNGKEDAGKGADKPGDEANSQLQKQTSPVRAAQPTQKLFNNRVIRPLPSVNSSRRLFAQTRSLPVGLMRFGEPVASNRGRDDTLLRVAEHEEEEDWSMPANGASAAVATPLKLPTLETDTDF
jgi:hypothetical protein